MDQSRRRMDCAPEIAKGFCGASLSKRICWKTSWRRCRSVPPSKTSTITPKLPVENLPSYSRKRCPHIPLILFRFVHGLEESKCRAPHVRLSMECGVPKKLAENRAGVFFKLSERKTSFAEEKRAIKPHPCFIEE